MQVIQKYTHRNKETGSYKDYNKDEEYMTFTIRVIIVLIIVLVTICLPEISSLQLIYTACPCVLRSPRPNTELLFKDEFLQMFTICSYLPLKHLTSNTVRLTFPKV